MKNENTITYKSFFNYIYCKLASIHSSPASWVDGLSQIYPQGTNHFIVLFATSPDSLVNLDTTKNIKWNMQISFTEHIFFARIKSYEICTRLVVCCFLSYLSDLKHILHVQFSVQWHSHYCSSSSEAIGNTTGKWSHPYMDTCIQ